jgi:ribosomal protein S15P/S13E
MVGVWAQLWPNLAANVLWVPVAAVWAWAHRRWSKKHMAILHERIVELRQHIENLTNDKEAS